MDIVRGDFLKGLGDEGGLVAAPTNGVIAPAGLVMGAGAALALARHRPALRQALARRIEREGVRVGRFWRYGFVAVRLEDRLYGAFQSKLDFRRGSDLELVRFSAERLRLWLVEHPGVVVHLAFPGIGLGGLSPEAVWGVLEATLAEVSGAVRLYRK
ncbi:MAG: hypothetical protein KatS3mg070_2282 [Meiothermus sp.]|uniref:hypothetical protein n=1 Tax=Meiothermus sp. TaxID=1955249 RepID=UPI0021DD0D4A|nr:hypothetical protein [Meiothermus sp.]GIW28919.1 MAG: hypothetical protein KatS3mg070_2282 [Meiothermus sp.]